jgi:hypothetical protein
MAKVRSPNYPQISLAEAVARVKMIFQKENRHPADRAVIARAIGYGGLNGKSLGMISALTKYGLLEPAGGDQLRLSEMAVDLAVHSPGDPERVQAVRRVAFLPSLFTELHDQYGDTPPSDQNLRAYLVKRGFNPQTVDGVIRSYRDTMAFVEEETAGFKSEPEDTPYDEEPMQTPTVGHAGAVVARNRPPPPPVTPGGGTDPRTRSIILPLSLSEWATLQAPFPLTEAAWKQMLDVLNAMKPALVSAAPVPTEPALPPQETTPAGIPVSQANAPAPSLTPEAQALLEKVEGGGVPMYTTGNLTRIANENGVSTSPDMGPNQIIEALRQKA